MAKTNSAVGTDLGVQFDEVRKTLLQTRFSDRLSKPLQYWVLPSDRRLPLALLDRTLGDLLATPFEELSATPGIGEKKINSLVKLLGRATRDEPPSVSVGVEQAAPVTDRPSSPASDERFHPELVSEALWAEWRQRVRQFAIEDEKLGRLAPSLQRLPTVIWHTPLKAYLDHTVAEIRSLRTHGEKRVRCVLEVFHSVYHRLAEVSNEAGLTRPLTPPWIRDLEDWVERHQRAASTPTAAEVSEGFVQPLLDMIDTDCGTTVLNLVKQRLGVDGQPLSVREQARVLSVTRARIYQLLDDCAKVMAVRWPDGKTQLDTLSEHFIQVRREPSSLRLFYGLRELCFPEKQSESAMSQATRSSDDAADRHAASRSPHAGGPRSREAEATPTRSTTVPISKPAETVGEVKVSPARQGAEVVQRDRHAQRDSSAAQRDSAEASSAESQRAESQRAEPQRSVPSHVSSHDAPADRD